MAVTALLNQLFSTVGEWVIFTTYTFLHKELFLSFPGCYIRIGLLLSLHLTRDELDHYEKSCALECLCRFFQVSLCLPLLIGLHVFCETVYIHIMYPDIRISELEPWSNSSQSLNAGGHFYSWVSIDYRNKCLVCIFFNNLPASSTVWVCGQNQNEWESRCFSKILSLFRWKWEGNALNASPFSFLSFFFFIKTDRSVYTLNAPTFLDAFLRAVLYHVGLREGCMLSLEAEKKKGSCLH